MEQKKNVNREEKAREREKRKMGITNEGKKSTNREYSLKADERKKKKPTRNDVVVFCCC